MSLKNYRLKNGMRVKTDLTPKKITGIALYTAAGNAYQDANTYYAQQMIDFIIGERLRKMISMRKKKASIYQDVHSWGRVSYVFLYYLLPADFFRIAMIVCEAVMTPLTRGEIRNARHYLQRLHDRPTVRSRIVAKIQQTLSQDQPMVNLPDRIMQSDSALKKYYAKLYQPQRMWLCVVVSKAVPKSEMDAIRQAIITIFDAIPKGRLRAPHHTYHQQIQQIQSAIAKQTDPMMHLITTPNQQQAFICFVYPSNPVIQDNIYTFNVMMNAFFKMPEAILFKKIRAAGVTYYIDMQYHEIAHVGQIRIWTETAPELVEKCILTFLVSIRDCQRDTISENDLSKAQAYTLNLEELAGMHTMRSYYYAMALELNYRLNIKNYNRLLKQKNQAIMSITLQDIQKMAQQVFVERQLNIYINSNLEKLDFSL